MAKMKQNQPRSQRISGQSVRAARQRRITVEGARIVSRLEFIQQKTFDDQKRLGGIHPTWESQLDARFTAFSKLINGLNSTKLSVVFIETCLQDHTWWRENFPVITVHDRENNTHNFVLSAKHNFGMSLFILVENTLRIILRAIDPAGCSGGTEAFDSIYACLFRSKLSNTPPEVLELLKLVRLVRNTIHNDGIYRHKKGLDDAVTYKGVTYTFNHGKPINFVTWDFLLLIADDIRDLLMQIVSDVVVAELDGQIIDQTATV
jgi:hypothetical protein